MRCRDPSVEGCAGARSPRVAGGTGRSPAVGDRPQRHCLTPPVVRPDCQYRCRNRKAMMSGRIETNAPVMTVENSAWEPEPAAEVACHWARPTVSGYRSELFNMISG